MNINVIVKPEAEPPKSINGMQEGEAFRIDSPTQGRIYIVTGWSQSNYQCIELHTLRTVSFSDTEEVYPIDIKDIRIEVTL